MTKIPPSKTFYRDDSARYGDAHAVSANQGCALLPSSTFRNAGMKRLFFLLGSMLVICLLAPYQPATAQSATAQSNSDASGIVIPLPSSLMKLPSAAIEQGQLLVSARTQESASGFPTFNALLMAGSFPGLGKSAEKQAEHIVSSYRLVGLADATLDSAVSDEFKGFSRITANLVYRSANLLMSSRVVILHLADKHLILTWTAPREQSRELETLSNTMLESISIPPSQRPGGVSLSAEDTGIVFSFPHAIEAITALIILVAGAFVIKRRVSRREDQED